MWEIDREMDRRGVKSPLDLTEFDNWVNEATRRDIRKIASEREVFGLKVWEYRIISREELMSAGPFEVDLIFLEEDREKVLALIEKHKRKEIDDCEFVKRLFDMAYYDCLWV